MILFLYFDGVLHPGNPIHSGGRYSRLPLLSTWLRLWPSVDVVISSSWRQRMGIDELRGLFPPCLRNRVLGVTPVLPPGPAQREREINEWLLANDIAKARWVALDDDDSAFSPGLPNLVLCRTSEALTVSTLLEVEQRLGLVLPSRVLADEVMLTRRELDRVDQLLGGTT